MQMAKLCIWIGLTVETVLFLAFLTTKSLHNIHSGLTIFLLILLLLSVIAVGVGVLLGCHNLIKNPTQRKFKNLATIFFGVIGILVFIFS